MIDSKDIVLIKDFIKREAQDYTPSKDEKWVNELNKIVISEIEKITEKVNFIHIASRGNVGCLQRELVLTPTDGFWDIGANVHVDLCTCGKLNHWGKVSLQQNRR